MGVVLTGKASVTVGACAVGNEVMKFSVQGVLQWGRNGGTLVRLCAASATPSGHLGTHA